MGHFDHLFKELYTRAYLGKTKHFKAAARFESRRVQTGIPIILINILLGSILFANISATIPDLVKWISAFIAAIFGGIQAYFDYQKKVEMHNIIANKYLNIEHNLNKLYNKLLASKIDLDEALHVFDELDEKYLSVVAESIPFPTNKRDFKHALQTMNTKKNKEEKTLLK